MNLDTQDFLRVLIQGQQKTNKLLGYILIVAILISTLLLGARWSWWSL